MNLSAGQKYRLRHREWTWATAGEGEGGTNWESSTDRCTLPCVRQTASGKLLLSTGAQPAACDDLGAGW